MGNGYRPASQQVKQLRNIHKQQKQSQLGLNSNLISTPPACMVPMISPNHSFSDGISDQFQLLQNEVQHRCDHHVHQQQEEMQREFMAEDQKYSSGSEHLCDHGEEEADCNICSEFMKGNFCRKDVQFGEADNVLYLRYADSKNCGGFIDIRTYDCAGVDIYSKECGLVFLSSKQTAPGLATPGSALHKTGHCTPCSWNHSQWGCRYGKQCIYCHCCPPGEQKRRKRAKREEKKARHNIH